MTSPSKDIQEVETLSDEDYLKRINLSLIKSLPFQVQPIDEGRFALVIGFASIIPKDPTEEDAMEAMKRVVIDILKISDIIQKKD